MPGDIQLIIGLKLKISLLTLNSALIFHKIIAESTFVHSHITFGEDVGDHED